MPFQDCCAFIERCFAEPNPQTGRSCSGSLPASGKWVTEVPMEVLTPTEYAAVLRQDFRTFIGRCFLEINPQTRLLMNWHVEVMAAKLEECRQGKTPHHQYPAPSSEVALRFGRTPSLVAWT
jgi:hypothetical protein